MVDAIASFSRNRTSPSPDVEAPGLTAFVSANVADYHPADDWIFSPSQSPGWIRAFATAGDPDIVVSTLSKDGRSVMALALEVTHNGPFAIARFCAGRHANGNFPALDPCAPPFRPLDLQPLFSAIAAARPDIDLIVLERLADHVAGRKNPLLAFPHRRSPNLALAVDLSGGFEEVLARSSGKRKRKKHRGQMRKYEAAGGHRLVRAGTAADVDRLLEAFFTMKQMRFRKMGVRDVFADPQTKAFLRRLFVEALEAAEPAFFLDGLEVGGILRAVTGSSRCGDRVICEFGAILEDELSGASPGDFLFFENIARACDEGLALYDFSVGDEPYKRQWCDVEERQYDALVPLSARGRVLSGLLAISGRSKAFLKSNRIAWGLAKAMRRGMARPAVRQATERPGIGEDGGS